MIPQVFVPLIYLQNELRTVVVLIRERGSRVGYRKSRDHETCEREYVLVFVIRNRDHAIVNVHIVFVSASCS